MQASGDSAMWYWDKHSCPSPTRSRSTTRSAQRYFCSVLAQTYPNRRFLFCGTASGLTATNDYAFRTPAANGTIFNQLLDHNISWLNYVQPTNGALQGSPLIVPEFATSPRCVVRMRPMSQFLQRRGERNAAVVLLPRPELRPPPPRRTRRTSRRASGSSLRS